MTRLERLASIVVCGLGLALPGVATALGGPTVEIPMNYARDLAVGDVNGDGRDDLVAIQPYAPEGHSVLLSRADGSFDERRIPDDSSDAWFVALADMNGDGALDVVVVDQPWSAGGQVRVYLGDGQGGFQPALASSLGTTSTWLTALAIGDLDGDQRPDLAVAASEGQVDLLYGNGDGTLGRPASQPLPNMGGELSLTVADLTGDGRDDVAVAGGEQVALLASNGTGFDPARSWDVLSVPAGSYGELLALAASDVNRDGVQDLVAVATSGYQADSKLLTLLGPGQPGFDGSSVESPLYRNPPADAYSRPTQLALIDLDGNTLPDAVILDNYTAKLIALYNVPSGGAVSGRFVNLEPIFPGRSEYQLTDYPEHLAVGDVDGDLVPDFATAWYGGLTVQLDPTGLPPVQDPIGDQQVEAGLPLTIQITARPQDTELYPDVYTLAIVHTDPALDINGDGHVDLIDLVRVNTAAIYGLHDPAADWNHDGINDSADWTLYMEDVQRTPPGIQFDSASGTLKLDGMTPPGTYTVTAFSYQPLVQDRETFTITVVDPAPASQLTGLSASASSTYSSSYAPGKALDGQRYSYWIGTPGQASWTLTLDLGGLHQLDHLELDWLYAYTSSNFDLQVSSDGGQTFVPLAQGLDQAPATTSPYIATTTLNGLNRVQATHMRLVIHQIDSYFPVVSEFRVFGW